MYIHMKHVNASIHMDSHTHIHTYIHTYIHTHIKQLSTNIHTHTHIYINHLTFLYVDGLGFLIYANFSGENDGMPG